MAYLFLMHTVAETPIFQKYAKEIWSEKERMAFIEWIAANPAPVTSFRVREVVGRSAGPARGWASAVVSG